MSIGYHFIVLHAHLPFVHHPESDEMLEERWLYEALTETYIPLLKLLEKQDDENITGSITMGFSPTLISMLEKSLLQERYLSYLYNLQELAKSEIQRTKDQPEYNRTAEMYLEKFHNAELYFRQYDSNLITPIKNLVNKGKIELITCCATHAFLPLYQDFPEVIDAQVSVAVDNHHRQFGVYPKGMWLPECGYFPGLEDVLKSYGIEYFFVETHGLLFANPKPKYGNYAPIKCQNGVLAFARDQDTSKQVWSATEGYPGDPEYREFYRDIGHDLEFDYIKKYLPEQKFRVQTGIKYYKVTGTDLKKPYSPNKAIQRADIHADHFMQSLKDQIDNLGQQMDISPLVVSPFDAELFGHWWYEGPLWLDNYMRKSQQNQSTYQLTTPSQYLMDLSGFEFQTATPALSSWGENGYCDVWLDDSNSWIYPLIHKAITKMTELANKFNSPTDLETRALNQAAREILLAQSSDWAFIMHTGTVVEYAKKRVENHLGWFNRLYNELMEKRVDDSFLTTLEVHNSIFPNIDYRTFAK